MFCRLETVDFSLGLGEVGYFIIYQKPKKRKNKAAFIRKYMKYFIKFLKNVKFNFIHSVILKTRAGFGCPKVACSRDGARDGARDFFVIHSGEKCIVSRAR